MFIGGVIDKSKSKKDIDNSLNKIKKVNCFKAIKYKIEKFSCEHFGVICITPSRIYNSSKLLICKEIIIAVQGQVFDLTIKDICQLYENKGDRFVNDLDGQFNILIYERKKKNLKIFNDRIGALNLYYTKKENFVFGNNIKSNLLFHKNPEISRKGIYQLFRIGHMIGDETLFEDVKCMPPASILNYNKNLDMKRYWIPVFKPKNKPIKWFVEEFNKRLINSVKKIFRNKKNCILSLSGGLDSRAIAGAIDKAGLKVDTFTYGHNKLGDCIYSKKIAKKLGFNHFMVNMERIEPLKLAPFVIWQNEGNFLYTNSLSPFYHKILFDKKIKTKIGGQLGDDLSGQHTKIIKLFGNTKKNAEFLLKSYSKANINSPKRIFNHFFENEQYSILLDQIMNKFRSRVNSFSELKDLFNFENRKKRFILSGSSSDSYLFDMSYPFLDKDMIEFWLSVPKRLRFSQSLYKKAILKSYPKINNIPWEYTGKRIEKFLLFDFLQQSTNYFMNKIKIILNRNYTNKTKKIIDYRKIISDNKDYKKIIFEFLESDYFPEDIFDKRKIKEVVHEHYNNTADHSNLINLILTLNYSIYYLLNIKAIPQEIEAFVERVVEKISYS